MKPDTLTYGTSREQMVFFFPLCGVHVEGSQKHRWQRNMLQKTRGDDFVLRTMIFLTLNFWTIHHLSLFVELVFLLHPSWNFIAEMICVTYVTWQASCREAEICFPYVKMCVFDLKTLHNPVDFSHSFTRGCKFSLLGSTDVPPPQGSSHHFKPPRHSEIDCS